MILLGFGFRRLTIIRPAIPPPSDFGSDRQVSVKKGMVERHKIIDVPFFPQRNKSTPFLF